MGVPDIQFYPMTPAELDGVMEVERLSYQTPWTRDAFLSEIIQTYTVYLVAKDEQQVASIGGMHVVWEDAHITNIAVHPRYRGIGLGERMMRTLIQRAAERGARRMTLEVRAGNFSAQNLYRKLGFITAPGAIRKGYYTDTQEDAIVMWKDPLIEGESQTGAS